MSEEKLIDNDPELTNLLNNFSASVDAFDNPRYIVSLLTKLLKSPAFDEKKLIALYGLNIDGGFVGLTAHTDSQAEKVTKYFENRVLDAFNKHNDRMRNSPGYKKARQVH